MNVMFLCFFPFCLTMCSSFVLYTTLLRSLFCVICTRSPAGSEPKAGRFWANPMWGLSHKFAIIGKFKYKVWNFLQTPHIYTFYRYFWMGWIVLGDFICLQVPFLGSIQVPKLRCLVALQIIKQLPLNNLGIHSSIKSVGTWISP